MNVPPVLRLPPCCDTLIGPDRAGMVSVDVAEFISNDIGEWGAMLARFLVA